MNEHQPARLAPVLAITIVVLAFAALDIFQPRLGGPAYMPVFSVSKLEDAPLDPVTQYLTATDPGQATGIWSVRDMGSSIEVNRWKRKNARRFERPSHFNLPRVGSAVPFAVGTWKTSSPVLYLIGGSEQRPTIHGTHIANGKLAFPTQSVARLGPIPRGGARTYKIATWSGRVPDLFVIQRDRDPQWDIQVFSGESGFRDKIYSATTPEVISQHLLGKDFAVDLGEVSTSRPDLILVTTGHPSGSEQTELHLLSGSSGFQEFKIRIGTNLPGILPGVNDFLYMTPPRQTGPDGHRVPGVLANLRRINAQMKVFQLHVRY